MDYQVALEMALKKELLSVRLYKKLAANYPSMRDLFEPLLNEEEKHVAMINKMISKLKAS